MAVDRMRIFFDKNTLQLIRKEAWEGDETPELKQIEIDSGILAENEDMIPLTDPVEINNALTATTITISGAPGNYSLSHDFTPPAPAPVENMETTVLAEFPSAGSVAEITDQMVADYAASTPVDSKLIEKLLSMIVKTAQSI